MCYVQSGSTRCPGNPQTADTAGAPAHAEEGLYLNIDVKGQITKPLGHRTLVTYVNHSGNYSNDSAFSPAKRQLYYFQEINLWLKKDFLITGAPGIDAGDLSGNTACPSE
jgi:hypothetical protein